jgi:hypothetical protein
MAFSPRVYWLLLSYETGQVSTLILPIRRELALGSSILRLTFLHAVVDE